MTVFINSTTDPGGKKQDKERKYLYLLQLVYAFWINECDESILVKKHGITAYPSQVLSMGGFSQEKVMMSQHNKICLKLSL